MTGTSRYYLNSKHVFKERRKMATSTVANDIIYMNTYYKDIFLPVGTGRVRVIINE